MLRIVLIGDAIIDIARSASVVSCLYVSLLRLTQKQYSLLRNYLSQQGHMLDCCSVQFFNHWQLITMSSKTNIFIEE